MTESRRVKRDKLTATRYPGGKNRQLKKLLKHLPDHDVFVDGFGGSGSVGLNVSASADAHYIELNQPTFNLLKVLRNRLPEFLKCITEWDYSEHTYLEWMPLWTDDKLYGAMNRLNQAVATFMKFNMTWSARGDAFSLTKSGPRKHEEIRYWNNRIYKLPEVSARLKQMTLHRGSALDICPQLDGTDVLHYFDPPYVGSTRKNISLYDCEMSGDDHMDFLNVAKQLDGKVIISGYPSALYSDHLSDWRVVEYVVPKHSAEAGERSLVTEVLWCNF